MGSAIKGNHKKVTKGGKKLLKFVEKEGMLLANAQETCKGTWTRDEGGTRSILDYIVVDAELGEHVQEMKVHDKDKNLSPFHLKKVNSKKIRTIYSDHNPIVFKTNLVMMQILTNEKKTRKILTEDGRKSTQRSYKGKRSVSYGIHWKTLKRRMRNGNRR